MTACEAAVRGFLPNQFMIHEKLNIESQQSEFCLYRIDREGWFMTYDSLEEAEGSLEWIDINSGEYLLIDNDAHLYEGTESSGGFYGYTLRRSGETRPAALSILQLYSDDQQLTKEHLALLGQGSA